MDIVTKDNLGDEFDLGTIEAGKVRLKLGSGLTILPDGTITATGGGGQQYFEQVIWAEEASAIAANSNEYSYGNGATGNIGIPSFWDCEAVGMIMDADVAGTSATIALKVADVIQPAAYRITSTQESSFFDFATPLVITRGQRLGFITHSVTGSWSDVRVGVVLRIPIIT